MEYESKQPLKLSYIDIDYEIQKERTETIQIIGDKIHYIKSLQSELGNNVEKTQENLDNVSTDIETTNVDIFEATENLQLALQQKKSTGKNTATFVGGLVSSIALGPICGGAVLGLHTAGILALSSLGLVVGGGVSRKMV